MNDKQHCQTKPDFQEPSVKRAKRIAAIIYILLMTFIVGGTYYHQQQAATELDEFNNPMPK